MVDDSGSNVQVMSCFQDVKCVVKALKDSMQHFSGRKSNPEMRKACVNGRTACLKYEPPEERTGYPALPSDGMTTTERSCVDGLP